MDYLPCLCNITFEVIFGHKIFICKTIVEIFAVNFMTKSRLNISKKLFCFFINKVRNILENAFSEMSFSTLVSADCDTTFQIKMVYFQD